MPRRKPQPGPQRARPGRPPGSTDAAANARRRLLEAAAVEFAAAGFAATSLRAVAARAGVTPAMVPYYFGDKWGLLEAVLVDGFERVLEGIEQSLSSPDPAGEPLGRFITACLHALNAHAWLPHIVVREILSRQSPLRQLFVERFAYEVLKLITPLLRQEVRAGRLRPDLDNRLTVLSVIGMCVFPYVAEPLLGQLLDYRVGEAFAAEFIPHTVALLEHGLLDG